MNRTRYWLSSKKLQMAQLKDLSRQLQEAWDEQERLDNAFDWASMQATECEEQRDYLQDQLHRVARERDNERKLRLDLQTANAELLEALEKVLVENDEAFNSRNWKLNAACRAAQETIRKHKGE